MTIRDMLWKKVKYAIAVQIAVIILAMIVAGFSSGISKYVAPVAILAAGVLGVLFVLFRTKCPSCQYPIALNGPIHLRPTAGRLKINYCPHCGLNIDEPCDLVNIRGAEEQ
jgi:hypothetical protein